MEPAVHAHLVDGVVDRIIVAVGHDDQRRIPDLFERRIDNGTTFEDELFRTVNHAVDK